MSRKIDVKSILDARGHGLSLNQTVKKVHASKQSVFTVCERAKKLNVSSQDLENRGDNDIYRLFFPGKPNQESLYERPDYEDVVKESRWSCCTQNMLSNAGTAAGFLSGIRNSVRIPRHTGFPVPVPITFSINLVCMRKQTGQDRPCSTWTEMPVSWSPFISLSRFFLSANWRLYRRVQT